MKKTLSKINCSSKHFKNAGEVCYLICPMKDRPLPTSFTSLIDKETPLGRFVTTRERTIAICKPLYVEDFVPKFSKFKSIKWHLGHPTWLMEKLLLRPFVKKYRPFHEKFEQFFSSLEDLEADGEFSRPSLDSLISYRNYVDEELIEFLKTGFEILEEEVKRKFDDLLSFVINLEKDAQEEILTQIKSRFYESEIRAEYLSSIEESSSKGRSSLSPLKWVYFEGGLINVGADGKEFALDMEMPRHTRYIEPFEMAQRPVTNGEFLQFIEEGGYERGGLWLAEGWEEIKKTKRSLPKFWKKIGSTIKQYTLSGLRPLRLNEPVSHISFFEADAFARYAKARLPSEFEWEFASESLPPDKGNFFTEGRFHPEPLCDDDLKISSKLKAMFGDVWEWTTSLYCPYPGYQSADVGLWKYTGRLEGSKRVVRGGSCLYDGTDFRRTMRKPISMGRDEYCTGLRLVRSI